MAKASQFADGHGGLEHPALDCILPLGSGQFQIRRTFALMRRLENAFGPLHPLLQRLWQQKVTADEVQRLYILALEDVETFKELLPIREEIEAHIMQVGIAKCCEPLATLVACLFVGNAKAADLLRGGDGKSAERAPATPLH
jgi:hypothetical protein